MWSQELPWISFVSKPAPPAGIVSHYHVFLMGCKRKKESALSNVELCYNFNALRFQNEYEIKNFKKS